MILFVSKSVFECFEKSLKPPKGKSSKYVQKTCTCSLAAYSIPENLVNFQSNGTATANVESFSFICFVVRLSLEVMFAANIFSFCSVMAPKGEKKKQMCIVCSVSPCVH